MSLKVDIHCDLCLHVHTSQMCKPIVEIHLKSHLKRKAFTRYTITLLSGEWVSLADFRPTSNGP